MTIIFYSKINFKKKNLSIILAIFFIIGAFLSIYHLGIEQGVFKESFVCSTSDNLNLNKEQLLQQLQKMSISCKNVTFRIFGFLTTYNLLLSIIISIYLLRLYAKKNKTDQTKLTEFIRVDHVVKEVRLKFMKDNC